MYTSHFDFPSEIAFAQAPDAAYIQPETPPEVSEAYLAQRNRGFFLGMAAAQLIFTETLRAENTALQEQLSDHQARAGIDEKTGLYTAPAFQRKVELAALPERNRRATDSPEGGTFILLDIDFLKKMNNVFPYTRVDEDFIKPVARALLAETRESDVAGRFGGDEMMLYLHGTPLAEAHTAIKRIYAAVNARQFDQEGEVLINGRNHLGVSMGVVAYPPGADYVERLDAANRLLKVAKDDGRNTYVDEREDEIPHILVERS